MRSRRERRRLATDARVCRAAKSRMHPYDGQRDDPAQMGTATRDPGPGDELDFPVEEWNAVADAAERR